MISSIIFLGISPKNCTFFSVKTTGEAGGLHRPYTGLIQQRLKTHERFANRK